MQQEALVLLCLLSGLLEASSMPLCALRWPGLKSASKQSKACPSGHVGQMHHGLRT